MVKVTSAASAYSTRPQETKSQDGSVYEGEFTKKDDDRIEHK
jgi:hypothetical protein